MPKVQDGSWHGWSGMTAGALRLYGGRIVNTQTEIKDAFVAYYCTLYLEISAPSVDALPRLDPLPRAELDAHLQIKELQLALIQIAHAKTPGTDVLPVEYFAAFSATLSL
ncbi:hypothetical protein NDU88_005825 [Pleurodeles waltl]|uniref:Uncharacterized protein n=1 Tax=Pleurodeles waltl TaxID=8319 RepID=A0AAV7LMA7_PLEWA|nr:hypothetical protein NDU88_005825 [Pleurodeles waltl]